MSASLLSAPGTRRRRRTYKTSGTFVVPADVWVLYLLLVSGGGGGGGTQSGNNLLSGSGGSGWPIRYELLVVPGDVVAFTVGAGGAGGSAGGTAPGSNGGDTVVTVNGVEVIRVPGGGGGGASAGSNGSGGINGRDSNGVGGCPGSGNNPYWGGGGAGWSPGFTGNTGALPFYPGGAGAGLRCRYGRRPPGYNVQGSTGGYNGIPYLANDPSTSLETYLWITERFPFCAGGDLGAGLTAAVPAQPANSGNGGTGTGNTSTAAALKGGDGGSGFVDLGWDLAA